tara:strand:+ start:420 stop:671 length:252 start_codon:yes stop_codon:yes gene_type:complete
MSKTNKSIISVYLRSDELSYLRLICEKTGRSRSAYIRGLLNTERFGTDQTEMDLDMSKNNLPLLLRKVVELENRMKKMESSEV